MISRRVTPVDEQLLQHVHDIRVRFLTINCNSEGFDQLGPSLGKCEKGAKLKETSSLPRSFPQNKNKG